MEKVKRAVDSGFSFATAVKEVLGETTEAFCARHGLTRQEFSGMLNGRRVPSGPVLDALIAEQGGTRKGWLDLWFSVAQRKATAETR
jgi:hypothetical protein